MLVFFSCHFSFSFPIHFIEHHHYLRRTNMTMIWSCMDSNVHHLFFLIEQEKKATEKNVHHLLHSNVHLRYLRHPFLVHAAPTYHSNTTKYKREKINQIYIYIYIYINNDEKKKGKLPFTPLKYPRIFTFASKV